MKKISAFGYRTINSFLKHEFRYHLVYSSIVHLILILFSEIQDAYLDVKFTDIDYTIFSDGARFILNGSSPFERETYRYTPLLAWMMTPNIYWFPQFGKIIFSIFDILSAWLIYKILHGNANQKIYSLVWLYNPLSLIISCRGSSESVICTIVILVIYFMSQKQYTIAGMFYGFVVHFKIYPIIYALSLYLAMSSTGGGGRGNKFWSRMLPNRSKLLFISCSFLGLFIPTISSYLLYGQIYLDEAWLYHFYRQDIQHNFSPYFYFYQFVTDDFYRKVLSYSAFIPQFGLIIISSFYYNYNVQKDSNLFMSLFVETIIFVTLNKVITAQYFEWYICLLPLVLPSISLSPRKWLNIFIIWIISILQWLLPAYLYEFRKWKCLDWVGFASIAFTIVNLSIVVYLQIHFISKSQKKKK